MRIKHKTSTSCRVIIGDDLTATTMQGTQNYKVKSVKIANGSEMDLARAIEARKINIGSIYTAQINSDYTVTIYP